LTSSRIAGSPAELRPIQLQDILAWKGVNASEVSPDGRWFGYRVSPLDGDSEVVVRETRGTREYRVPVGEVGDAGGPGGPGGAGPSQAVVSRDSTWAAVTVMPSKKEPRSSNSEAAREQGDPAEPRDRRQGEIPRISDLPSGEAAAGRAALNPAGAAAHLLARVARRARPPGRPSRASDLLLRELATASVLAIGNVADFAFDKSGRWLAYTIEASDQIGNALQLRDMQGGVVTPLDSEKASYERPTWTETGDGLTVLKGVEDKRGTSAPLPRVSGAVKKTVSIRRTTARSRR
jgi:hypothetical protein